MRRFERSGEPTSLDHAWVLTDDAELRSQLSGALVENGLEVVSASGPEEALRMSRSVPSGVTFLDLDMTSSEPRTFLEGYLEHLEGHTLVVLASERSIPRLMSAVDSGVSAYLKKPLARGEVRVILGHVQRMLRQAALPANALCGASPEIQSIRKLIQQSAQSGVHLTVSGEPGAGKRIVGRLIHEASARRGEPFLQISCAGFRHEALESLMFGAGGGEGYLAECARGTLLIDDVDLMPARLQGRLRDHLSGVSGEESACPRIVAVTSRSLAGQVRHGEFDPALFGLLSSIEIEVPPLRERRSDIPILADYFCRSFAKALRKSIRGIDPAALAELMRYDWPGNVRELEDMLEYAVGNATGGTLEPGDFPALPEAPDVYGPEPRIPGATIDEIEKDAILRTLEATGGSTGKAAAILEMSVRKIQYKLKEYRSEAAAIAATERMPSVTHPRSGSRKHPLASRSRQS